MKKPELLQLLSEVSEQQESPSHKRVLLIDGLNLFFRNFAMLNMVNPSGAHIGGLGGFLRSLGPLIRDIQPTEVYIIFDGMGSANNRKNLIPEYKSGRNTQRITNWDTFDDLEEEHDAKITQIVRLVQYLKTLPVKTLSIDKVEADDIIAYLCSKIPTHPNDKVFIVSSDKDFLQLINQNVIVYRPIEKEFYTEQTVLERYNIPSKNFIIYKTLLGDSSDKIRGVKGLGPKGILKKFPELAKEILSLSDVFNICEFKLKTHVVYARILQNLEELEKNYKVMDLSNPMLDEHDKKYLNEIIQTSELNYHPEQFILMYKEDQLGGLIRNPEIWVKDMFEKLCNK